MLRKTVLATAAAVMVAIGGLGVGAKTTEAKVRVNFGIWVPAPPAYYYGPPGYYYYGGPVYYYGPRYRLRCHRHRVWRRAWNGRRWVKRRVWRRHCHRVRVW